MLRQVRTEAPPAGEVKGEKQRDASGKFTSGESDRTPAHDLAGALGKMAGVVPQLGEVANKLRDVLRFMEGLRELQAMFKGKEPPTPGTPPPTPPEVPQPPGPGRTPPAPPGTTPGVPKPPGQAPLTDSQREELRRRFPGMGTKIEKEAGLPSPPKAAPAVSRKPAVRGGAKPAGPGAEAPMPKENPTERLIEVIEELSATIKAMERKAGPEAGKPSAPDQPPIRYGTRRAAKIDMSTSTPSNPPRTHAAERSENTVPYGELLGNVLGKGGAAGGEAAAAAAI